MSCNIHANLFKGLLETLKLQIPDHSGHPVQI